MIAVLARLEHDLAPTHVLDRHLAFDDDIRCDRHIRTLDDELRAVDERRGWGRGRLGVGLRLKLRLRLRIRARVRIRLRLSVRQRASRI